MTEIVDVVVIGAGLAGLTAGATARACGASAVVLEAHHPGGRARVVERDGYRLNMGAHALVCRGEAWSILSSLGVVPEGAAPPLRRYQAWHEGTLGTLPTGPGTLLTTRWLGMGEKRRAARVLARLPRLDPAMLAGVAVADYVAGLDLPPRAAALVLALLRLSTYADDLGTFDAGAAIGQIQRANAGGVAYLHGGWASLYDRLGAKVDCRRGAEAGTVTPAAGRIEVSTPTGPVVGRSVVVAAGTPPAARRVLPADPGWGDLGPPVTAACLDLGLQSVPEPGYVLGIDVPLYATTQSPPACQCRPGHAVLSVLRYGARDARSDRADMETIAARAGVAREDVVTSRLLARMVVAGAAPLAGLGGLAGRPPGAVRDMPGVYVAGDWVGGAGLLADAAVASGHAAGQAAAIYAGRVGPAMGVGR